MRAHENHVSLVDKLGCGLTWVSFLLHDITLVQQKLGSVWLSGAHNALQKERKRRNNIDVASASRISDPMNAPHTSACR